jgi:hypothetical protein
MDEHTAYLGVKNESLLEMVKGKFAEIETAFKVVIGHRVNVKLQVATPDDSKSFLETKSSDRPKSSSQADYTLRSALCDRDNYIKKETDEKIQASASDTTFKEPSKPPEVRPIEKPLEPLPPKQPSLPVVSEPIVKNHKSPETQSNTIKLEHELTVELDEPEIELGDRNENAIPDYIRDELQKAAQNLAKCFEGEIVTMDLPMDEQPSTTKEQETDLLVSELSESDISSENDLETSQLQPRNPPIIREKFDLSNFPDEDDIPF